MKGKITLCGVLFSLVILSGCLQLDYIDVSPSEAKELIENNPDLIIVDASTNYAEGHIPNAVNYPLGPGIFDMMLTTFEKDGKYLVYCHLSSCSVSAAEKMVSAGFKNIYRLDGEYRAWIDAGYEVEAP